MGASEEEGVTLPHHLSLGTMRPTAATEVGAQRARPYGMKKMPQELPGAAAFVMVELGKGRVVLISPLPESTHGDGFSHTPGKPRFRRVLQRAVLLAAAAPRSEQTWIQDCCQLPGYLD